MRKTLILMVMVTVLAAACSSGSTGSSSSSKSTSSSSKGSTTTQQTSVVPEPVQLPGKTNNEGTQDVTAKSAVDIDLSNFFFTPTFIEVNRGQSLGVHLSNSGTTAHTFTMTEPSINETLQPGETKDVTVPISADTTEFHCSFHQSSGMQGAFFVSA